MDVNLHKANYTAFIVEDTVKFNTLAGIVLGVGFFPLTIFLMYLFCKGQPNTKQKILTGIPLVVLLLLGVSLIVIPILYKLEIEQLFSQLGTTNDEGNSGNFQGGNSGNFQGGNSSISQFQERTCFFTN